MSDGFLHDPHALREEAERYLRLAQTLSHTRDCETVMAYCRELLERAKRLETATTHLSPRF